MLSFSKSDFISRLAEALDLELLRGKDALKLGGAFQVLEKADTQGLGALNEVSDLSAQLDSAQAQLQQLEGVPFMTSFLESAMEGARGPYGGHQLLISKTRENQNRDGAFLALMFSKPLPCQLYLYPERFSSRIGKLLFRQQDVQLGESELDPLIMIKTPTPEETRRYLGRRDRVETLTELYREGSNFIINQLGIRFALGAQSKLDNVVSILEKILAVAGALTLVGGESELE